jgi:hypothetical protein
MIRGQILRVSSQVTFVIYDNNFLFLFVFIPIAGAAANTVLLNQRQELAVGREILAKQ